MKTNTKNIKKEKKTIKSECKGTKGKEKFDQRVILIGEEGVGLKIESYVEGSVSGFVEILALVMVIIEEEEEEEGLVMVAIEEEEEEEIVA